MTNTIKLIRKHPLISVVLLATLIIFTIPILYALAVAFCVITPIYLVAKIFGIK